MAAYHLVYDSRHLQADCQEPGSAPEPALGNRVWAAFFIAEKSAKFFHFCAIWSFELSSVQNSALASSQLPGIVHLCVPCHCLLLRALCSVCVRHKCVSRLTGAIQYA